MKKHTRDVFSVLEVPTAPPSFNDILEIIYTDIKDLKYDSHRGTFERGTHGTTSVSYTHLTLPTKRIV